MTDKNVPNIIARNEPANKTHSLIFNDVTSALKSFRSKIQERGDLKHITVEEQLFLLEDLSSFRLGKHILLTGGANGIWTDYLISPFAHINNLFQLPPSILECFFLFHSPVVLAQRELLEKLQKVAQTQVKNGKVLASIPCGVMRDLLSLDYSSTIDVKIVGIDIDPLSLSQAKQLATTYNVKNTNFIHSDAWNLGFSSEFDFISSIGLNMYEPDKEKVVELYKQLYNALKPGGTLFTGVLTWPPYINKEKSDWILQNIPKYNLHLEEVIHKDLLDIKWLNFRSLDEIEQDFIKAGFNKIEIQEDSRRIFPAIIAKK